MVSRGVDDIEVRLACRVLSLGFFEAEEVVSENFSGLFVDFFPIML